MDIGIAIIVGTIVGVVVGASIVGGAINAGLQNRRCDKQTKNKTIK
jgi:hypothetical protein